MSCTKVKRRRQEKILTVAGKVPTIPTVADHCTSGWLSTDIYKGEICINVADQIVYSRGDTGIFVLNASASSVTNKIITSADFTGSTITGQSIPSLLNGLTADIDFSLYSNDGSGALLKVNDGYTFVSGTGVITTTPGNYRLQIIS